MSSLFPLPVLYTGALKDLSGYAEAARGYALALDKVGLKVSAEAVEFEPWKPMHLLDEIVSRRMWTLLSRENTPKIQVIHLTPENYHGYKNNGKRRIGYYAWETSRLPGYWVKSINQCVQEAWVPCEYLKEVSIKSGVKVPVKVFPHVIPVPEDNWVPSCTLDGISDSNKFKFYSIFQWSERKGADALLRAYYREFSNRDNVMLVLKTYRVGNSANEKNYIRRAISQIRRDERGGNAPPVFLVEEFLSPSEMKALHYYGDCYVCMSRNEGFGLPIFDSAAFGNPVITPNYSAFPDHFTEQNSFLVDVHREVPVANMQHISHLYTGDMYWGDPEIGSCQARMREVFENKKLAEHKGQLAKEYVASNLSQEVIGMAMARRLIQIADIGA